MLVRSSESRPSTDVGVVGVEVVGVGVHAVEQPGQPQPHGVEVGVGADVGLVLGRRREVLLGTEPRAREQDLADLHQQQGYDGAGVLLARHRLQRDEEGLDRVGDLLRELLELGGHLCLSHRRFAFLRMRVPG